MGECWYCYWGWAKPVKKIFDEASEKLQGDHFLCYGPAHIVWDDENFDDSSIKFCIDNFDKYADKLNTEEKEIVMWSLTELIKVPVAERCIVPEEYAEEHPENFPPKGMEKGKSREATMKSISKEFGELAVEIKKDIDKESQVKDESPEDYEVQKMSVMKFENIGDLGTKIIKLGVDNGIDGLDLVAVLHIITQTLEANFGDVTQIDAKGFADLTEKAMRQEREVKGTTPDDAPDSGDTGEATMEDFEKVIKDILATLPPAMFAPLALNCFFNAVNTGETTMDEVKEAMAEMEKALASGSDATSIVLCSKCDEVSNWNSHVNSYVCTVCGHRDKRAF